MLLGTLLPSCRKRCLSAPDVETEIKKPRNNKDDNDNRQVIKARINRLNLDSKVEKLGESSRNINENDEGDKTGN